MCVLCVHIALFLLQYVCVADASFRWMEQARKALLLLCTEWERERRTVLSQDLEKLSESPATYSQADFAAPSSSSSSLGSVRRLFPKVPPYRLKPVYRRRSQRCHTRLIRDL